MKLIAVDLDGTLLDRDHVTIPEKNVSALRAARAIGVKVAVATGRSWSLVRNTVAPLGGLDYVISANGAAVLEVSTGRWLLQTGFPCETAGKLIDFLEERKIPFEFYCEGENYVRTGSLEGLPPEAMLSDGFAAAYQTVTTFVPDLKAALAGRRVEKFDVFYVPPDRAEAVRAGLWEIAPMEISNALATNLEFTPTGVNKGTALQALARSLDLVPDEVMAFGDAGNDLEMLQWAGWSFAMENGADAAKAAARYLAPPNYEGGVGQMVERYVLTNL